MPQIKNKSEQKVNKSSQACKSLCNSGIKAATTTTTFFLNQYFNRKKKVPEKKHILSQMIYMKFQSKKLLFTTYFLTGRTTQKLVLFLSHIKFSSPS